VHALERVSILLLVGSTLLLIATGVMNIQYDYAWGFSFYTGHFYAAWVFIAAFGTHVVLKLPLMVRTLRSGPPEHDELAAEDPAEQTISRRGALAAVGGSSLTLLALSLGQSVDPLRATALLSPRGQVRGDGPNDFLINTTFRRDRRRPDRDGLGLAAAAGRSGRVGGAGPGRSAGDGAAHRKASDRVRGGVVDVAVVDRRAAARPRRTRGR